MNIFGSTNKSLYQKPLYGRFFSLEFSGFYFVPTQGWFKQTLFLLILTNLTLLLDLKSTFHARFINTDKISILIIIIYGTDCTTKKYLPIKLNFNPILTKALYVREAAKKSFFSGTATKASPPPFLFSKWPSPFPPPPLLVARPLKK